MAYIDFYDIAGTLESVSKIVADVAPSALVRQDAFQRHGYSEVHRVYLVDPNQRVLLNTVTEDTFPIRS